METFCPDLSEIRVGITMGDYAGVGPEILVQCIAQEGFTELCPIVIYGSGRVLSTYRQRLGVSFSYELVREAKNAQRGKINVLECAQVMTITPGMPSQETDKAAYAQLLRAVEDWRKGEIDVLITMPVRKRALLAFDPSYSGVTRFLSAQLGAEALMYMVSDEVKVILLTEHIPLREVSIHLSKEKVESALRRAIEAFQIDFGIAQPKVAVLALNPHAGEEGHVGSEEDQILSPVVTALCDAGHLVMGPFPADSFWGQGQYRYFDGVVAMYHDQGLIPFKMLSGREGYNYTAGLPLIRTAPVHGTAYDIAGQGVAEVGSFLAAFAGARLIYQQRCQQLRAHAFSSQLES
ncbi:MAG: 4-hydroxythreonine-4-phosphate dehydrogenase PdxA [Bacteroidia bacterium]